MVELGVEQLPVRDRGEAIGVVARADILEAGLRPLEQEEVEPGWLPARYVRIRRK